MRIKRSDVPKAMSILSPGSVRGRGRVTIPYKLWTPLALLWSWDAELAPFAVSRASPHQNHTRFPSTLCSVYPVLRSSKDTIVGTSL